MIKLELIEELGKGTIDWLTLALREDLGKVRLYDSTREGIVTSGSGQTIYTGRTKIRSFGEKVVAFTLISQTPELYVAFACKELENTEWNNER